MRNVRIWSTLLITLLLAAACADSPTAPGDGTSAVGTGRSSDYILDPIVVIGDPNECDPWMSLSWCSGGGGTCMSSDTVFDPELVTMAGCTIGGGGGGGTGGGTGGGGGGTTQPADPDNPPCDPRYDPECNQPLSTKDKTTIATAKQRHLRPASQFTDPAKAQQCAQLSAEFDRLYSTGSVFRGGTETAEGDPLTPTHVALYHPDSGTMHFEPSALDKANAGDPVAIRNIMNSALHEAAHALGFVHTDPVWAGDYDLFVEAPFNLLSPGANSCLIN